MLIHMTTSLYCEHKLWIQIFVISFTFKKYLERLKVLILNYVINSIFDFRGCVTHWVRFSSSRPGWQHIPFNRDNSSLWILKRNVLQNVNKPVAHSWQRSLSLSFGDRWVGGGYSWVEPRVIFFSNAGVF